MSDKAHKIQIIQNVVLKQPNTTNLLQDISLPSTSKGIISYLEVPEKPVRKNKRETERVSFAITSRLYQESFERKCALK